MRHTESRLDITEDELLQALSVAGPTQGKIEPGWFTVDELVNRADLGLGATAIRRRLHALIISDKIEYKKVARTSLLGSRYWCNAFGIKANEDD